MSRRSVVMGMLLVVAYSVVAWGVAPSLVNYQGEVTDINGPVAGTYPMTFRIFAASGGGLALWTETVPAVTLSNGRFNVLLGQVTALPESIFDGNERWLEIVFNAELLPDRVRLVTVPYAHRISTVDGATGGDITSPVILTTADPGNSLEVYNTGGGRSGRFENTLGSNSESALLGVNNGSGPAVTGFSPNGGTAVQSAGDLVVDDFNFFRKFTLDATGTNNGGELLMFMGDGTETVELRASDAASQGAMLRLRQADGNNGLLLDGDDNDYGEITLYKGGIQTMILSGGDGSTGSIIQLKNAAGTTNIEIDGDDGSGAKIEITNGSDAATGTASSGFFQMGSGGSNNIVMDDNEIMARNNGAADTLFMQNGGGETYFTGKITGNDGSDAAIATASSGYLQLGLSSGANLLFDNNEIISRTDGLVSDLHLQAEGGTVLIGLQGISAPTGYILAVDGKAIMEEVEVQLSGDWPDYVFEDDYDLMPIDKLAEHVRAKKHLPGMPSESEMKDGRLPLGEMQTKLLEKVEELTLYVLQLEERLAASEKNNAALQDRVETIETKSE